MATLVTSIASVVRSRWRTEKAIWGLGTGDRGPCERCRMLGEASNCTGTMFFRRYYAEPSVANHRVVDHGSVDAAKEKGTWQA